MPRKPGKPGRQQKKPQPKGGGHAALIRDLWEAAVNLRGSIEPADYKRYVLPIISPRFLSLRYERRRHELERIVREPTQTDHWRRRWSRITRGAQTPCGSEPFARRG